MKTITLTASFDGEHIRPDEPSPLPPEARLLVTILPEPPHAAREAWHSLSKAGLTRSYLDDEPDYPSSLVRNRGTAE